MNKEERLQLCEQANGICEDCLAVSCPERTIKTGESNTTSAEETDF